MPALFVSPDLKCVTRRYVEWLLPLSTFFWPSFGWCSFLLLLCGVLMWCCQAPPPLEGIVLFDSRVGVAVSPPFRDVAVPLSRYFLAEFEFSSEQSNCTVTNQNEPNDNKVRRVQEWLTLQSCQRILLCRSHVHAYARWWWFFLCKNPGDSPGNLTWAPLQHPHSSRGCAPPPCQRLSNCAG